MRTTEAIESVFESEHLDLMTECDELRRDGEGILETGDALMDVVDGLIELGLELRWTAVDLDCCEIQALAYSANEAARTLIDVTRNLIETT